MLLDNQITPHALGTMITHRAIILECAGFIDNEFDGGALSGLDTRGAGIELVNDPIVESSRVSEHDFHRIALIHLDLFGVECELLSGHGKCFYRYLSRATICG